MKKILLLCCFFLFTTAAEAAEMNADAEAPNTDAIAATIDTTKNEAAVAETASMKVVIDVEGMTCSLCVTSINQALRGTEGVIKAKTSLKTNQAEVLVPEGFPVERLLEAIAQTGYVGTISGRSVQP